MNEAHALARSAQKPSLVASIWQSSGTAPAEIRIAVMARDNPLTGNCGPSCRPVRRSTMCRTPDVTRTILLSQLSCRAYAKDQPLRDVPIEFKVRVMV
jgi:hypothetical protein